MTKKKLANVYVGVKSAMEPSAQFTGLCALDTTGSSAELLGVVHDFLKFYEFTPEGAIVGLLYSYGLRISEVLNISGTDILSNGTIVIRGSKGSENRLISPVYYPEFFFSLRGSKLKIGDLYSRFFFYRQFKKFGIYAYFGNNKHASVTHSLRHLSVLNLKEMGLQSAEIGKLIGHKSSNSIAYYEKQIRK